MTFDAGRIRHDGALMHYSRQSNGSATPSNWKLSATGDTGVIWTPESAGGSVSYGSNSNEVSFANAPGTISLAAHADHVHRGVTSVSHSSNTYTGPVTLETEGSLYIVRSAANTYRFGSTGTAAGGGGTTITVEEVDGSPTGSVSKLVLPNGTVSIVGSTATYTPSGGSGMTQAYEGYNTVGGTYENVTAKRYYCKSVTFANDCLVAEIEGYVRGNADAVTGVIVALVEDNSGEPGVVVGGSGDNSGGGVYLSNSASMPTASRWFGQPVGKWITAGTYWICIQFGSTAASIAYDSGSDHTFDASVLTVTGAYPSAWTITTGSRKYSIRANTFR